jgi:hypothetical protein
MTARKILSIFDNVGGVWAFQFSRGGQRLALISNHSGGIRLVANAAHLFV